MTSNNPTSATLIDSIGEDIPPDDAIDLLRIRAAASLSEPHRTELGQYFTTATVSRLMASMFRDAETIDLLDAGAGSGSLLGATVLEFSQRERRPSRINVTAYEIERSALDYLNQTTDLCADIASKADIAFEATVIHEDFISLGVETVRGGFFGPEQPFFSHAILNPPYGKVGSNSRTRRLLKTIGVETGNLYTAFLALAVALLQPGGELVAITPRSFCNGPYFRPFRRWFLSRMAIDRIHVFDSRSAAFSADDVLQENVIFHALKSSDAPPAVTISASPGDGQGVETTRLVDYRDVVRPDDPDAFIHIVTDEWGSQVAECISGFSSSLAELGLSVSTGRVVDFRARKFLREQPDKDTIPLIYPAHFKQGYIQWPLESIKKPNALILCDETESLDVPPGFYVLVRRFSAKEEARRIVAAVYDHRSVSPLSVGFENHLNYYHVDGAGLAPLLARGIAAYLNSSLVDQYFRHFSGHTQVNATDLRRLPYPARNQLESLGGYIREDHFPTQRELDRLMREVFLMSNDPIEAKNRIEEALTVLEAIGMPQAQVNERSALTLLALLDLKPDTPWSSASNPLRGITPIMEFAREAYGKNYAPNTRETFRRQTMHQFVDAGIAITNPDNPDRAVNSPDFVYQIEPSTLVLLRRHRSRSWKKSLEAYLASTETLREKYAQEREMHQIAIKMPDGIALNLTPGGQNVLVKKVLDEFCSRFTPGAKPLYIGDTGEKFAYFDKEALADLGVTIEEHGKMPDVLVHHMDRNWLVIIEAVTSHGPVDPKRHGELKKMFDSSSAGLVFVTAFLTRQAMVSYLSEIAWETEVWTADSPSHLIHFNGERFLGPH